MNEERTGQPITCTSAEAVRLYQEAVDRMLGSQGGAAERLDQALAHAPDFALAAVARYMVARDARDPEAVRFRTQAEEAACAATSWERQHVSVLTALAEQPGSSVDVARSHMAQTPGDLLVISQLSGYLFFYGGRDKRRAVLDLLESVEPVLGNDWAFQSRLGFAASEIGQRTRGRNLLERALKTRPEALYSIHGLAHVLHDDGDIEESATLLQNWLRDHESSALGGQMFGHVQWHLALKEWQLGEEDSAGRRFQRYCAPEATSCGPVLSLADCGGFLIRKFLGDAKPTPLSASTSALVEDVWGMLAHPFVALNVAGLFLSAADESGLERCRDAIDGSEPGAYRDLASSLVSAITHFAAGDYQEAQRLFASVSPEERVGIGGSNVERELVELIENEAGARMGLHRSAPDTRRAPDAPAVGRIR